MKTSAAGRALIEQREGRRLAAYADSVGVPTIGVGHTGRMSPPKVTPGMTITEAECDAMLATDLAPVEAVINAAVKVPISQNEFDALASLGFNIGAAGLRGSTVVEKLNQGDVQGAADAFLNWEKPAVLKSRRLAERAQFLRPDAPNAAGVSRSLTVANARAQTLAVRAAADTAKAKTTRNAGGALALGGTAAVVATAHAQHGHLALWILGVVAIGAAIDGVIVWRRHQSATTLSANAAKQVAVAATIARTPPAGAPAPVAPVAAAIISKA